MGDPVLIGIRFALYADLMIVAGHRDIGPPAAAIIAMRRSLIAEVSAALIILALVAWPGTLEPIADAL